MATIGDEDSATQSSRSSPSTPSLSNPGTPRSELTQEVRATPPLPQPPISSSVQRTIPGQLQAQQAQVLAQSHIQQQQALHQLVHQPQNIKFLEKKRPSCGWTSASDMALERSEISTLQMLDTGLYADCVEWCPFDGLYNILLCGTYQLLEEPRSNEEIIKNESQIRVGQLQMYCLQQQIQGDETIGLPLLASPFCLDMPGILDIKWARHLINSLPLFGLVNAAGECQLWKLSERDKDTAGNETPVETFSHLTDAAKDKECLKRVPECLKTVKTGNCLALSLDWAGSPESTLPKVVVSDSSGYLSVLEAGTDFTTTSKWHAHDYEVWICAFDQWNHEVLYSGSDDCKLKVWDLRAGTQPVKTNSGFDMGVCSIQSNPVRESLLGVGSYDENLRIFDTRNMRQPLSVTSLGGGVWRVKWEPWHANSVLTASMHNGFHVVDCSLPDSEPLPILAHYTKHGSLGYGADWCRLPPGTRTARKENDQSLLDIESTLVTADSYLVCTCSFYDHSLQLWQCTI